LKHDRNIYLSNMALDEAVSHYTNACASGEIALGEEVVPTVEALGRVTAGPVFAALSAPWFNASAMDGIAVNAASTYEASERRPVVLNKGKDYIIVDTGDPILDPWDAVIMVEDLVDLSEDQVEIRAAISPWDNVRPVGEDIVAGELILPAYHKVTPIDLGALLSGGINAVKVIRRPRVAILPTGTEIIEPGEPMEIGKIIESNSRVFEGIIAQCGGEAIRLATVADDYPLLVDTLRKAAQSSDMVIIIAGSSAGTEDFTSRIIEELGEVFVHGIALKPGKPAILGKIGHAPVIGVPGYPVSAWVVFDTIVKPLLYTMQHQRPLQRPTTEAVLSRRLVSSLKNLEVVRVKLGKVGDQLIATPLNRGAGVTMSLVRADGLLEIPQSSEGFEAGMKVPVKLLRPLEEIESTVVVIGSHDLVIDLLADHIHTQWPDAGLSSAHVGSLGGVMAIVKGEAHLAPIHLLDEATGEYNLSYVKKLFPDFTGFLIRGVKRTQGLMIPKGNPKGIKGLEDLTRSDLRFVNRQKGSGTRLLLDHNLKIRNMDSDDIQGYDREMTTHMAVASAVASGTADAGLGVRSAAVLTGLDFIPVGDESYDFLVAAAHYDALPVQRAIEALRSEVFKQKVLALGGYSVEGCGEVVVIE